jgi:UDP:flavonoid glycosyltransferase YjiC (YdhE family)
MKILLAPFGSRGDVHPMIALAQRLDREGHDVVIAGPPDYAAGAERLRAALPSVRLLHRQVFSRYRGRGAWRAHRAVNHWIEMSIDDESAALPTLARGFDLIVGAAV